MGVYINMEMPSDGRYTVCVTHDSHGVVHWVFQNQDTLEFLKHGAVTEVPEPHGRLIDADALAEDLKRQCEEVFKIDAVSPDDFWITRDQAYNERLWKTWCESFFEYLKTRETIIPESEEG